MPLRKDIHKVMVLGSGPIVIGQAAEFRLRRHTGMPCAARRRSGGYSGKLQSGYDYDRQGHGG